jgi:hypothetical protein
MNEESLYMTLILLTMSYSHPNTPGLNSYPFIHCLDYAQQTGL